MESVYKKLIGKCIQEPHIYESNDSRIGQGDNVNYIHLVAQDVTTTLFQDASPRCHGEIWLWCGPCKIMASFFVPAASTSHWIWTVLGKRT